MISDSETISTESQTNRYFAQFRKIRIKLINVKKNVSGLAFVKFAMMYKQNIPAQNVKLKHVASIVLPFTKKNSIAMAFVIKPNSFPSKV